MAQVDTQLAQVAAVAQDAHADEREYLLGVKTVASGQIGLIAGLGPNLNRFGEVYGHRIKLTALSN